MLNFHAILISYRYNLEKTVADIHQTPNFFTRQDLITYDLIKTETHRVLIGSYNPSNLRQRKHLYFLKSRWEDQLEWNPLTIQLLCPPCKLLKSSQTRYLRPIYQFSILLVKNAQPFNNRILPQLTTKLMVLHTSSRLTFSCTRSFPCSLSNTLPHTTLTYFSSVLLTLQMHLHKCNQCSVRYAAPPRHFQRLLTGIATVLSSLEKDVTCRDI